jgi:hypothetical protein
MQQARTVEEEEAAEVVRNHGGGTRTRRGSRVPKVGWRHPAGSGLLDFTDGGAIFDNPRRGCPAAMPGGTDRAAVGRDGAKVTRGAHVHSDE